MGDKNDGEGVERGKRQGFLPCAACGGVAAREGDGDGAFPACLVGHGGGNCLGKRVGGWGRRTVCAGDEIDGSEQLIQWRAIDEMGHEAARWRDDGVLRNQIDEDAGESCFAATRGKPGSFQVASRVEVANGFGLDSPGLHALIQHPAFEHGGVELEEFLVGDEREAVVVGRRFRSGDGSPGFGSHGQGLLSGKWDCKWLSEDNGLRISSANLDREFWWR